jgi:Protein of unknown function (DUF3617)
MFRAVLATVALGACALSAPVCAETDGIDLRLGGWIMAIVAGDDPDDPTPATHSCLTPEELEKMHNFDMSVDEGCTLKPISQTRTRLEATVECVDEDGKPVTSKWVMEAQSPEVLEVTATAVIEGETQTMVISGRWIQWGCGGFDAPFPNS